MIVELVVAGAAVMIGGFVVRRLARRRHPPRTTEVSSPPARRLPRGFGLDDVVLYLDEEMWLAGSLELDEEGFVCRLFRTPGRSETEWLAQLDPEARLVALLRESNEVPAGRVPERLPIDGFRLNLERRGRASVIAAGEHLPAITEQAEYTILAGSNRRLIVLDFSNQTRLALAGDVVSREMLELLPGQLPL